MARQAMHVAWFIGRRFIREAYIDRSQDEPPRVDLLVLQHARTLVLRHGWNAVAYQVLNPGMELWFSDARDAVIGYATHGGVRVVAGAPVCPEERVESVADEFERDSNAHGERVVFFGAGARLERVYLARHDHSLVKIGAQPVWNPQEWGEVVRTHASLRAQLNRARNKGVSVREWSSGEARHAAPLQAVLEDWLGTRGLPPLGFMVTPYLLGRLEDRRVFVAERGDSRDAIAFLVATPVPARGGWLVEEWPRSSRAPNGTTQLLVDGAMRAFAAEGCSYATLGLAPLSVKGENSADPQPRWFRLVLHWARAHGRRFYNFEGLEAFKAGMHPAGWDPIYAVAQGRRFTPGILHAIAGVFAGGSPEWLVARALLGALRSEARRVVRRARSLLSGSD